LNIGDDVKSLHVEMAFGSGGDVKSLHLKMAFGDGIWTLAVILSRYMLRCNLVTGGDIRWLDIEITFEH
jgi:hypothetical protein